MIRGKLWFRCAAMHDPVTPVVVQPALIGWEAKREGLSSRLRGPSTGRSWSDG